MMTGVTRGLTPGTLSDIRIGTHILIFTYNNDITWTDEKDNYQLA